MHELDSFTRSVLLLTFIGLMIAGSLLAFLLSPQEGTEVQTFGGSISSVVKMRNLIREKSVSSLIPLLFYSGVQQAFIW